MKLHKKTKIPVSKTSYTITTIIVSIMLLITACNNDNNPNANNTLEIFIGSASQPPTEQLIKQFEKETNIKCKIHYGGSGEMLSQMIVTKRGDIYFPGSSDYMQLAVQKGVVEPGSEKIVAYLIPAIIVPINNPANITSLNDLTKPNTKIGIARPDSVCVGLYATEILEKNNLTNSVKPNIITYTTSCSQTVQIASLNLVDAVIGWRVFQYWNPKNLKAITIQPNQIARIGYIPIATSIYSKNPAAAKQFIDYITSEKGETTFKKWNYITNETEARKYATQKTPIGGTYNLPNTWKK